VIVKNAPSSVKALFLKTIRILEEWTPNPADVFDRSVVFISFQRAHMNLTYLFDYFLIKDAPFIDNSKSRYYKYQPVGKTVLERGARPLLHAFCSLIEYPMESG